MEVVEVETREMEAEPVEAEIVATPLEHVPVVDSAPAQTPPEPPVAPLFPWLVNACEGTRHELVLEPAIDFVPARAIPSLAVVELTNELPVAPLSRMPWGTFVDQPTHPRATTGTIDVRVEPVRPRMGAAARPAVEEEEFPTAPSVKTPVRASKGTLPTAFPSAQIDLGPARIDPSELDPSRGRIGDPRLGFASRSRLELHAQQPSSKVGPVQEPQLPAGFSLPSVLPATEFSKNVPRKLSFGAPRQTPALSSQLKPVESRGFEPALAAAEAIGAPTLAPRLPQFASLGLEKALNWNAASPGSFVPTLAGRNQNPQSPLASPLHKPLPLTLASVIALDRSGEVGDKAKLAPAGLRPRDLGHRSEFRASSPVLEDVLLNPTALVALDASGTVGEAVALGRPGFLPSDPSNPRWFGTDNRLFEDVLVNADALVARETASAVAGTAELSRSEYFVNDYGRPSEAPTENLPAEGSSFTASPGRLPGLGRVLTAIHPVRIESYRAIAEMSTCAGSVAIVVQHVGTPAKPGLHKVEVTVSACAIRRAATGATGTHSDFRWVRARLAGCPYASRGALYSIGGGIAASAPVPGDTVGHIRDGHGRRADVCRFAADRSPRYFCFNLAAG